MKVVIVGGVAGGASAAARLRRLDEQAQIVIFERTGFVSYANCGLPYYIGGVIEEESALTLQSPQGLLGSLSHCGQDESRGVCHPSRFAYGRGSQYADGRGICRDV